MTASVFANSFRQVYDPVLRPTRRHRSSVTTARTPIARTQRTDKTATPHQGGTHRPRHAMHRAFALVAALGLVARLRRRRRPGCRHTEATADEQRNGGRTNDRPQPTHRTAAAETPETAADTTERPPTATRHHRVCTSEHEQSVTKGRPWPTSMADHPNVRSHNGEGDEAFKAAIQTNMQAGTYQTCSIWAVGACQRSMTGS